MDYPKLYVQLPKQPRKWSVQDTAKWLDFIGLPTLQQKFRIFILKLGQFAIDGSCLWFLQEQDLRGQLNIKSNITIKKLMSWIKKGLTQYDEFLKTSISQIQSGNYSQLRQITQKSKNKISSNSQINRQPSLKNVAGQSMKIIKPPSLSAQQNLNSQSMEQQFPNQQQIKQLQLIIQQCDGPQNSFFSVKSQGAKIGRHSTNQILILDQSISRFHAQIKFNDGKFMIKDSGSTTGTFIKIIDKIQIVNDMITQMGSNQFQTRINSCGDLVLDIIQGPNMGMNFQVVRGAKITIGRKPTNLFSFPDDQHLSNLHATIFSIDGNFFLQDMGTTNGSWMRLSCQGNSSQFYQLHDKMIFKFGANQTYICKIKTNIIVEKQNANPCILCYQNQKDCIYMPCRHNAGCLKCSKNLKDCPICRVKIQDILRIYKT